MNPESKCQQILNDTGPLLGSILNKHLVDRFKLTSANARKIIQREHEKGLILSSKPVMFQHRQYLYYLEGQDFTVQLPDTIQTHRKSIFRVYQALLHNNWVLTEDDVMKVSAATTDSSFFPRSETKEKLFNNLSELLIIEKPYRFNDTTFVKGHPKLRKTDYNQENIEFTKIRGQYINYLFTQYAIKWLERSNIIGWNKGAAYKPTLERVKQNGHLWDGVGFTYLYGYYIGKDVEDLTKKTPSLVYIEANFHRKTYIEDVEGFFIRIAMQDARMKHYPQGKRILPILFINGIETEALNKAREKGAMIISLQEILGPFSFELLHFINNPWKVDNVLENCNTLIKLIENQGRSEVMLPFLQELSMIKHLSEYKKQGWKIALNVILNHNQNKYQIPWLIYDPIFNTPHICGFIKDDQSEKTQIEQIVNNYYIPYKNYIKRLSSKTDKVNLFLFTGNSKISNNLEIETIIEEILFNEQ